MGPLREPLVLAIDLGKTTCRAALLPREGGEALASAAAAGAPGLADPLGVPAAVAAIRSAVAGIEVPDAAVVGAAGALAAPEAARALAGELAAALGTSAVLVTSDAILAHAGALGGEPGVVLVAGTGAVAVALDAAGRLALADGAGPWLGDEGGGAWIGLAGLRAALRAHDGRGAPTALGEAARARFGDLAQLPRALGAEPVATAAAFAPDVARAAAGGDGVAAAILADAARALAGAVGAAARGAGAVSITGGLVALGEPLLGPLRAALAPLRLRPAAGTPLEGARVLARGEGPHAPHVVRVGAAAAAGHALDRLPTEAVRSDLGDLDERPVAEIVALLVDAEARAHDALRRALPPLAAAAEAVAARLAAGGRLRYAGAGTSGRIALQDAAEIVPTFGTDPDLVAAVVAGGERAAATAIEGAEDDEAAGARDLAAHGVGPGDAVVGISASGRTPYVVGALRAARAAGALTVAIANAPGSAAAHAADLAVEILTGAEVLAGSTRLTAGTTQKIALNALSTAVMIRLGKAYGPWMVDVRVTNEKLHRRAVRIVAAATGVDDASAERALAEAGGHAKTAIVALATHVSAEQARERLARAGGHVRGAIR
jgi:N-acetylmuramic acid 6-phosphate etherase